MKVLLCLLSDNQIPNLLSIHHYKPDRMVWVVTEHAEKMRLPSKLRSALERGSFIPEVEPAIVELTSPDDMTAVRAAMRKAFSRFPEADWIANVTGGTKPMGIGAHMFFHNLGFETVYTEFSKPLLVCGLAGGKPQTMIHRPGIAEYIATYGFELLKNPEAAARDAANAEAWAECARVLAAHRSDYYIVKLHDEPKEADKLRKKYREKGMELDPASINLPKESEAYQAILHSFLGGREQPARISAYQFKFLSGDWLTMFFYDLLRRHAVSLGINDVRLEIEVGPFGAKSDQGNEWDVGFMRDAALYTIECKSGRHGYDTDGNILYKIEAIRNQFGPGVKTLLATNGGHVYQNGRDGALNKTVDTRAANYGCRMILDKDIWKLAAPDVDTATVHATLFGRKALS